MSTRSRNNDVVKAAPGIRRGAGGRSRQADAGRGERFRRGRAQRHRRLRPRHGDLEPAPEHGRRGRRAAGVRRRRAGAGDFDGDGRSDIGVFDPATGTWTLRSSAEGDSTLQLDAAGDVPVTGDFDGDGRSDIGVFDPASGTWTLRSSAGGDSALQLGAAGPHRSPRLRRRRARRLRELRRGRRIWTLRVSTARNVTLQLGAAGVVPVTSDFDGDGVTDSGCYAPDTGVWEIALSTGPLRADTFGRPEAVPVVGDFDGDGRTDIGATPPRRRWAEWLSPALGASRFFAARTASSSRAWEASWRSRSAAGATPDRLLQPAAGEPGAAVVGAGTCERVRPELLRRVLLGVIGVEEAMKVSMRTPIGIDTYACGLRCPPVTPCDPRLGLFWINREARG